MKILAATTAALLLSINVFASGNLLRVYAAASLTNVLNDISKEYAAQKILFNFDGSSKLAKQIEAGSPADLFFSADAEWMDYLANKNKIESSTRTDLLSNKIVVIVPSDAKALPGKMSDLNSLAHIALAGESVPAGKFARAALKAEGVLTETFSKKIVNADSVRIALSWVAGHEAEAGIVYATDAAIEPKVKIAFQVKESAYPKIIYPAAVVSGSGRAKEASEFLNFCKSKKAQDIFKKAGFVIL
jgi:molybdate transport system substrate-binding protein